MDTIEFVHISDFHYQRCYEGTPAERLTAQSGLTLTDMLISGLRTIRANHPALDFTAVTGDLTQHGTAEDYARLRALMSDELPGVPIFCVPGNHDDIALPLEFSRPMTSGGSALSHVDFRGLRIISLDSRGGQYESGLVTPLQLAGLAELRSAPAAEGSILLLHHTPHISGEVDYLIYQMDNPQALYDVIKDMDIRAIFAGHTHKHFTSMLGAIPCYTVESLTYGIEAGWDSMIIHNRIGYNHCVLRDGQLSVRHIIIEPEVYTSATILYGEMSRGFNNGD